MAETCVFSKQTPDPFHCGPPRLLHPKGHPLSRSYGVNLPSSFTSVLSSALESSSRLPVSVLVRARASSGGGFSCRSLRRLRGRMCPRPCGTATSVGPLACTTASHPPQPSH